MKRVHDYIYGRNFILVTDNKPLATILGPKKGIPTIAAARLQRWAMLLSAYQYTMVCKKSEDNLNADALSRLPIDGQGEKVNDYATSFYLGQLDLCPVDTNILQKAGEKDQLCSTALKCTQTGWPENVSPDMEAYFKRNWN